MRPTSRLVSVLSLSLALIVGACTSTGASPSAAPASATAAASAAASASPSAAASATASASAAASPSASAPVSASPSASGAGSPATSPSASAAACAIDDDDLVAAGTLTIGTDNPAFPPWFGGEPDAGSTWEISDPYSGEGLESATAYAIAEKLGFARDEVEWVAVPFNTAIQPGPKTFDMDLNQVSYSAERAEAVDLSEGYFDNNHTVVAREGSPIANAKSVGDLKAYRLGAQVGTTSLKYIVDEIQPATQPSVYNDNTAAIAALNAGQIDAIVVDIGTAFFITAAQMEDGVIVGTLPIGDTPEYFSVLLPKDSPLTTCVNQAIADLKADGTLDEIRAEWIETQGNAPALQP